MKENVKSVVVLTAICLVVAALLAVTNFFTAPVIEQNKANAANASLTVVMPDAAGFDEIELPADVPATVKHIYKETSGLGYVVLLSTTSQYSSGDMGITMGVGADGKICGMSLTSYFESKDFGQDTYPQTYIGQDSALGEVDTVAGVTYSSAAFKNAVTDAFAVLLQVGDIRAGEKSEEQLIAEVMPLALPGCTNALGNCLVTEIEAPAPATAAYKANNNCGYILIMPTDNGTVVCGINASGYARCFDLEGNDITDSSAETVAAAESAFVPLCSEMIESVSDAVHTQFGEEYEIVIGNSESYGSLCAVFDLITSLDEAPLHAYVSQPYGFGNTPIKMLVVLNDNGEIVAFRSLSEFIIEAGYFNNNPITNEAEYKESFIGLTESTYSEDDFLVAGATFTSSAAAEAARNAFEAFDLKKEAAN